MVIDHRLGHARSFRQVAEGQGFGAFFTHQLPGHVQQLAQTIFTRQATTRGRGFTA